VARRGERLLCRAQLCHRGHRARARALKLLLSLVVKFPGRVFALQQRLGARDLLAGQVDRGLLLDDIGLRLIHRLGRLQGDRLVPVQGVLKIARVHFGDGLAA
jgi:hypothetical protein